MILKPAYECYRCVLCADKMNFQSDIVVGDPWGIEPEGTEGKTAIIARTLKGEMLLRELADTVLKVEPIDPVTIRTGQQIETAFAKKVAQVSAVALKNDWMLPYVPDTDIRYSDDMEKRLKYNRKFYAAVSAFSAQKLADKKMRQIRQPVKTFFYKIKKMFLK